ncbi:hypothetical protein [Kiloniella antarctica]|uniref:Peptidase S9 prolyl oligopeptidase catalytic domain-containing protein n=1 Tax=Kiloniella antarctica TaxID=1550907 RepID=A0ABW5BPX5_9PROT
MRFAFVILAFSILASCQTIKPEKIDDPHGAFAIGDNFETVTKDNFELALVRNIPHPEKTILFIYNHGTENGGHGQECFPDSIPSYARAIVRQHSETIIYYLCSQEVGVNVDGDPKKQRYFRRSTEILRILKIFKMHGITADGTFLLGHSGGASTTLIAAADIPEAFNGFVVSAPGYGFAYTGRSRKSKSLAPHYEAWKAGLKKANKKDGLVYAFEGDTYAPPEDLEFMSEMGNITLIVQKPENCGIRDPHGYPWSRCFREKETPKIWSYIQQRINSPPKLISQN